MKKYSIGIDLGGTKILAGLVEKQSGKVISEVKNNPVQKMKFHQSALGLQDR